MVRAKKQTTRVVVLLEPDDAIAVETVIASAPIGTTRSAAVRAILRRGVPGVLADIANGVPVAVRVSA